MTTAAQPANTKALAPNTGSTVPGKNDWAVLPITKGKAKYSFPAEWGDGALHHKISKEKLASVAEQVALLYTSQPAALQTAVRAFWALCWELAGQPVTAAVRDATPKVSAHRLLWNLPINLSLGPKSPATDPGQAFDPDTVPDPQAPGKRVLDGVSAKLRLLEERWDRASDGNAGLGDFRTPALWNDLTALLREAHQEADEAGREGRLLYPPKTEQWLYDGTSHLRKGLTEFLSAAAGEQRFRRARSNAPSIAAHKDSAAVAATAQATTTYKGKSVTLTVTVTGGAVHHVGERHTFTFFDFSGRLRPITTLWPETPTFAALTALAGRLAPHLARICLAHLVNLESADAEDWPYDDIELAQQPAGEHCVYFVAGIEGVVGTEATEDDPAAVAVDVEIKTFAPNDHSGPGLLKPDLVAIGTALKARPQ